jgi:hypothetical protein
VSAPRRSNWNRTALTLQRCTKEVVCLLSYSPFRILDAHPDVLCGTVHTEWVQHGCAHGPTVLVLAGTGCAGGTGLCWRYWLVLACTGRTGCTSRRHPTAAAEVMCLRGAEEWAVPRVLRLTCSGVNHVAGWGRCIHALPAFVDALESVSFVVNYNRIGSDPPFAFRLCMCYAMAFGNCKF